MIRALKIILSFYILTGFLRVSKFTFHDFLSVNDFKYDERNESVAEGYFHFLLFTFMDGKQEYKHQK